jgi:hypothetical protein
MSVNALNELNAAVDGILANTDPAHRNVVRAWIRVAVASAKLLQTEELHAAVDRVILKDANDNSTNRG